MFQDKIDFLALYSEAGHWGRHYSAVRLTIGIAINITSLTLLVGSLNYDIHWLSFVATILWLVGLILFGYFSYLVRRLQNSQRKMRNEVMGEAKPLMRPFPWDDLGLLAILLLTIVVIGSLCAKWAGAF